MLTETNAVPLDVHGNAQHTESIQSNNFFSPEPRLDLLLISP